MPWSNICTTCGLFTCDAAAASREKLARASALSAQIAHHELHDDLRPQRQVLGDPDRAHASFAERAQEPHVRRHHHARAGLGHLQRSSRPGSMLAGARGRKRACTCSIAKLRCEHAFFGRFAKKGDSARDRPRHGSRCRGRVRVDQCGCVRRWERQPGRRNVERRVDSTGLSPRTPQAPRAAPPMPGPTPAIRHPARSSSRPRRASCPSVSAGRLTGPCCRPRLSRRMRRCRAATTREFRSAAWPP